ncbi:M12 family metallopeptidase [Pararhizobium gei]|uniref:M12 family metallopeptidase n=1 Tax=Pararhizobium gei TaxID=1395951 RepID=UPI0023DC6374|nr:M12 family metallopeptidase [Rhizobium gei]
MADGEQTGGNEIKTTFMLVGDKLRPVQYTVVDGLAVVEGCIVIGTPEEAEANLKAVQDQPGLLRADVQAQGVAIKGKAFRWDKGKLIYEIDPALPHPERVEQAMDHWRQNTAITFEKRDPANAEHKNYVRFVPGTGCRSAVGRRGGMQQLVLGPECTKGNVIHEIGHALGLFHEQSRGDRDAHIRIRFDRIQEGMEHNFTQHIDDGIDVEAYDFGSIMHYPLNAFSVDGKPTIELVHDFPGVVGQREKLSEGDRATIKKLYK